MSSNDPIDNLSDVIEPKRVFKIWLRVLICLILVGAGATITRISWLRFAVVDKQNVNQVNKDEIATLKREWYICKLQEIDALKHQLKTAREAFASAEAQRKATWISRESDREIYNKTLNAVLSVENNLLLTIKEYNTAAASANSAEIAGLASTVSVD